MSSRVSIFKPSRPGFDPCSLGVVENFQDGDAVTDYHVFEDKGEVVVFRTTKQHGCRAAKFLPQGMLILPDAEELLKFYNGKHPRKEKQG